MKRANNIIINRILVNYWKRKNRYFIFNIDKSEKIQNKILLRILNENRDSKYLIDRDIEEILKESDLDTIVAKYQETIPIVNYEDLLQSIEEEKKGNCGTLTSKKNRIKLFELTSGSTSSEKYIPYTKKMLEEYMDGVFVWLYDLYINHKELYKGTSYWSISPVLKRELKTSAGISVGIEDDTSYFNKSIGKLLNRIFAVPKELKYVDDMEDFILLTVVFLLLSENLTIISIWSPSFLNVLLDYIENNNFKILELIENEELSGLYFEDKKIEKKYYFQKIKKMYRKKRTNERVRYLRSCLLEKHINYSNIWKNLNMVSCWGDSDSEEFYLKLKLRLPKINFQMKGLMSTECIVSIPITKVKKGSVISYISHFYEFLEIENNLNYVNKKIKLLHELQRNKEYIVVVTTSGGLYRYNTSDIIRVVDFYKKVPVIKFIGRLNNISDIVGEKLESRFVMSKLKEFLGEEYFKNCFYILAPTKINKAICYTLFIECDEQQSMEIFKNQDKLNELLCESLEMSNICYKIKRK